MRCMPRCCTRVYSKWRPVKNSTQTGNLVPRAFSFAIFKMAARHFENCRGEGPGDEVAQTGFWIRVCNEMHTT